MASAHTYSVRDGDSPQIQRPAQRTIFVIKLTITSGEEFPSVAQGRVDAEKSIPAGHNALSARVLLPPRAEPTRTHGAERL